MTVLIATREGIWADRREVFGSVVLRPGLKLVRRGGIVAGFCGDSKDCFKALRAVRAGEYDPQALAAMTDGLVVDDEGIWELANSAAVRVPKNIPYVTNGSGHAEAQAFLAGAGKWDRATIKRALRYVARVRGDCGDGVDERTLR